MTKGDEGRPDAARRLADLQSALDAFGADRTRWPARLRHDFLSFIATNADAQRLLREAEAFDRLLDAAPTLGPDKIDALVGRICAAAERQPRAIHAKEPPAAEPAWSSGFGRRERTFAAAALAASLLIGIFAGQAPSIDPTGSLLTESSVNGDNGSQQLASMDEVDSLSDEDLL